MSDNLADLCSIVEYEIEFVNNAFGYLTEEFYKQIVEDTPLFSLLLVIQCKKKEIKGTLKINGESAGDIENSIQDTWSWSSRED